MSSECAQCGVALGEADKNAVGHYRDRCLNCISAAARDVRHVDQCDAPDCAVCEAYWQEYADSGGVRP